MKNEKLLDAMGGIDDALVAGAEAQPRKRQSWRSWAYAAACVCFIVAAVALIGRVNEAATDDTASMEDTAAYGFYLEGAENIPYYPIDFQERKRYGLLPEDAVGLSPENTYQITEADLGAFMGTVAASGDESLIGCSVYHFASFPNYDSICILDSPYGYGFYTAEWIDFSPEEEGASSDTALASYGLPESLAAMDLLTPDWRELGPVEDPKTAEAVLALLAGREDLGREGRERRFAQVWYDAYGNDDVFYSESEGHVVYREAPTQGEPVTRTDDQGNTIVEYPDADTSLLDTAQALWTRGERLIRITTDRGFQFYIDYFPAVRLFCWGNGAYALTEAEVAELNALLQITE